MKIVIATIEEPIYTAPFWEEILSDLHDQVRRIYVIKPSFPTVQGRLHELLYKIILALTLYRLPDLTAFFKNLHSIRSLAEKYKIPVQTIRSVNSSSFETEMKSLSPDFILAQVPMKVKKSVLGIPKRGWVNKHFGLLPDYRGAFPFLWAYWNGETRMGVTIHFMNEDYDQGEILGRETIMVGPNESIPSLLQRLTPLAARLMIRCVRQGKQAILQQESRSRYFPRPSLRQLIQHLLFRRVSMGAKK